MRFKVVSVLAAALGLGAVQAASAADMPAKAPIYKAPPVITYNWNGVYIGAFGGGLWAHKDWTFLNGTTTSQNPGGFFGGGQIGANWQFAPNWVLGAQLDWGWSSAKGSAACPNPAFSCTSKVRDLGSVTGRVGYAWDNWLAYVKGGGAWVNDRYEAAGASVYTGSNTPWGWTVGGGLEWGFAPNWSAFVEYDYYGFGTKRIVFTNGAGARDDFDVKQNVSVAKVGLNYRFTGLWR